MRNFSSTALAAGLNKAQYDVRFGDKSSSKKYLVSFQYVSSFLEGFFVNCMGHLYMKYSETKK